ncbi:putative ankyrin and het domain protein [Phaeoacremonium minimum UCRPA7]|uniref:Putative ankyrin and het domain protein n=1 Tax=Phaeoacremonium minimum (strain UCR-PA7) TaxID=1286976 RepID=R8BHQ5_PHAM7|nr:putative ankyrin and het domain protein [Phaeoacremonium minimum UCRPA7]EON98792.1 putative ankyrin and het domain protein [Phaeoacremonium minimum UCRPA7]
MPHREDAFEIDDKDSRIVSFNEKQTDYEVFSYKSLRNLKKNVRLLKILPGDHSNPNVYCQLFEAEIGDDGVYMPSNDPTKSTPRKIEYEALSWCWPQDGKQDHQILLQTEDQVQRKRASDELVWALKYLRYPDKSRNLWIDAICIDQDNTSERNHQVENMAKIYSFAERVCVWLGKATDSSKLAIKFIKEEIMQLQNFDELCANDKNAEKWQCLLTLMQRRWFSRRWVVQEIALAKQATVYCGPDTIPWKDFAVAVELFVEVETATHRLSEVMQKDPRFYHVPGWFEYVSELGASLLVQATGKVFRDRKTGDILNNREVDISSRRPLLSLEYLVSSLSTFDVTEPRDVVYSLLAIAKDTTPYAADEGPEIPHVKTQKALEHWTERKRYVVDYQRSYTEVCKDFIKFCITTSEPSRAVDIICRPWAPEPKATQNIQTGVREEMPPLPSWVPQLTGAPFAMFPTSGRTGPNMSRKNADTLVGMPMLGQRSYNAALTRGVDLDALSWRDRMNMESNPHFSMYIKGFVLDEISDIESASQNGAIPEEWLQLANWETPRKANKDEPPPEFWRTIVADRGRDGRNPPVYYAKACKESVIKGGIGGGAVNTGDLIHNERNSIIAQFCRRVQAVIWNRSLIKTKAGHLGIANKNAKVGDKICILYGCSVPVVLRQCPEPKTEEQIKEEASYDRLYAVEKALVAGQRRSKRVEERKQHYRERCEESERMKEVIEDKERRQRGRPMPKLNPKEKEILEWKDEVPRQTRDLEERLEAELDDKMRNELEVWLRMQSKKESQPTMPPGEQDLLRRVQTQPPAAQPPSVPNQQVNGTRQTAGSEPNGDVPRNRDNGRSKRIRLSEMGEADRHHAIKESKWRLQERKKASEKRKATVEEILDDHRVGKKRSGEGKKNAQPNREDDKWFYTFLGECYIHGMMDGEAMGYFNNNGLHSSVFEMR